MSLGPTDLALVLGLSPRGGTGVPVVQAELATEVVLAGLERFCVRAGYDPAAAAVATTGGDAETDVAAARDRGSSTVLAVESPAHDVFTPADVDGATRTIEQLEPTLTSARVAWHPADHPDRKKEQALGLTKLGAWLHETGRRLLLEVVVRPTAEDLSAVGGDRSRFEAEARPGLAVEAVREIRDLGTEPDLWAVQPPGAEGPTLLELVRDAGRDQVGLLVLLLDPAAAAGAVHSGDPGGVTRGVVLDRAAWAPAVRIERDATDGAVTGADAAAAVASVLERLLHAWRGV